MKRVIFVVLSIVISVVLFVILNKMYEGWGRSLIYETKSDKTEYPGSGKITRPYYAVIFAEPKGLGRPVLDIPEHISRYDANSYYVTQIPEQEQLLYVVGFFEQWESIEDSEDKYIILKEPASGNLEKYRVSFAISDLFESEVTKLNIEKVGLKLSTGKNIIEKPSETRFTSLGFEKIKNLIKRGDALVLVPIFEPPELSKKDGGGNYLVSKVIIRRISFKNEI